MRTLVGSVVLMSFLAAGCGGATDDTTAMDADSTGMMAEAAPAMLTADDVTGAWNGMSMAEVGDSVTSRWTTMRNADGTTLFMFEGSSDTLSYTTVFSGDSMVATSEPYADPDAPTGSPQVIFRSVGRLVDGKLVGTSAVMLATSPDSVVGRGRWEATRAP